MLDKTGQGVPQGKQVGEHGPELDLSLPDSCSSAVFLNFGHFKMSGLFWELNSTHLKMAEVGKDLLVVEAASQRQFRGDL